MYLYVRSLDGRSLRVREGGDDVGGRSVHGGARIVDDGAGPGREGGAPHVYSEGVAETELILVVDDDPHIREVVGFALKKAGYRVVEAKGGEEALALVGKSRPDLVVLDIVMPDKDGTQVCREIRATSKKLPIVFLSSRDDEIDRILGIAPEHG